MLTSGKTQSDSYDDAFTAFYAKLIINVFYLQVKHSDFILNKNNLKTVLKKWILLGFIPRINNLNDEMYIEHIFSKITLWKKDLCPLT